MIIMHLFFFFLSITLTATGFSQTEYRRVQSKISNIVLFSETPKLGCLYLYILGALLGEDGTNSLLLSPS